MRPTLPLLKSAPRAFEASTRNERRPLPKNVGEILSRFKGSIMEVMARGVPEDGRAFLAERWGFSSPAVSTVQPGKIATNMPQMADPTGDAAMDTAPTIRNADEQALMSARAAGAAARKALEAGVSPRSATGSSKMSGHEQQQVETCQAGAPMNGNDPQAPEALTEACAVKAARTTERAEKDEALHPILGQLVADLKYKRVYRTSITSLVKVPVWEKQRILRPERAMAIAEAKMKKKFSGIPGVITLFEQESGSRTAVGASKTETMPEDQGQFERLGIVDGQHRVGALMLMAERGGWDSAERNILVDVFRTSSGKEISDLFTEINRAEPVRLVDMPGEGATDKVKEVLNECTERMQESYAVMFKPSSRCRPPHVNIDNLRDEIFQSGLMTRHGLETADGLFLWLERVNGALERRGDDAWAELSKGYKGMSEEAFNKALSKAKKHRFFLGMDKSWLHVV